MTTPVDSKSPANADTFRTSASSNENDWGQPSLGHYFINVHGNHFVGEIISGIYLVASNNANDEDEEMDGLIAAYDEAKAQVSDPVSLEEALEYFRKTRNTM